MELEAPVLDGKPADAEVGLPVPEPVGSFVHELLFP